MMPSRPATRRSRHVECVHSDRPKRSGALTHAWLTAMIGRPSTRKVQHLDEVQAHRPHSLSAAALICLGLCGASQALAETAASDTGSFASPEDTTKRVASSHQAKEQDWLFESSGLEGFYQSLDDWRADTYKSTGLKLGAFHSTLFQAASNSLPGQDDTGVATITGLYGTWDVVEKGKPHAGQISFGIEARWGYGSNLTPSELGTIGIGSATGTSDPYGETDPNVVLREAFWHQGGPENGWNYRIGKITPDRMLTSSKYGDPVSMFLPVGSQGSPTIGFPDSGLGGAVGWFLSERYRAGVIVSDANGDRTSLGDIGEGNFFSAFELQARLMPLSDDAPFSTLTVWHTDGTDDPSNALDSSTGASGWGYFVKLEQEFSKDAKNIGAFRYGKSFDGAAAYKEQASIRYIRVDPPDPFGVQDDRFGIAASWVDPLFNPFDRNEWGFDTFYRMNLFKKVEASLAYQVIFDPTFNPAEDSVQVFSFRLTQFF